MRYPHRPKTSSDINPLPPLIIIKVNYFLNTISILGYRYSLSRLIRYIEDLLRLWNPPDHLTSVEYEFYTRYKVLSYQYIRIQIDEGELTY